MKKKLKKKFERLSQYLIDNNKVAVCDRCQTEMVYINPCDSEWQNDTNNPDDMICQFKCQCERRTFLTVENDFGSFSYNKITS